MRDTDPLLDYRDIAEMTGLSQSTLRTYRTQGRLPEPDELPAADRPRWRKSTVERWLTTRPGQGVRSDLRRPVPITLARYRGVVQPGGRQGDGPWETACRAAGMEPSIEMLGVRRERASASVAKRLGIEPGTPVVHRSRAMLADGVPVQLHSTWTPMSIAEGSRLTGHGIVAGGIFGELVRIGHPPVSVSETVGARMPTKTEVREMRILPRVPIVTIERITKGADGSVLELLRIASRADGVQITYEDLPLG